MHNDNAVIAQAYYTAIAEKNVTELEKYLDKDVLFVAPLATVTGKQAFLETLHSFVSFFSTLRIRSVFGNQDQAVVVYTVDFAGVIGKIETAALLEIKNRLIIKIQLFYDARPFEKK